MPRIAPTNWKVQVEVFQLYGCRYKEISLMKSSSLVCKRRALIFSLLALHLYAMR